MTPEEIVKAKWPKAQVWWDFDLPICVVRTPFFIGKMVELRSLNSDAEFSTEAEAWADAASRIQRDPIEQEGNHGPK